MENKKSKTLAEQREEWLIAPNPLKKLREWRASHPRPHFFLNLNEEVALYDRFCLYLKDKELYGFETAQSSHPGLLEKLKDYVYELDNSSFHRPLCNEILKVIRVEVADNPDYELKIQGFEELLYKIDEEGKVFKVSAKKIDEMRCQVENYRKRGSVYRKKIK